MRSLLQGDGMHNAGALLGPLIDSGIRVLIYSGEADMRKPDAKRTKASTDA
jgi:hypothetical protein